MIVDVDRFGEFRLDPAFLESYAQRPVAWGFGALSWLTYVRTYSRDNEEWWQTCRRVIEGMFTIQRAHCLGQGRPWSDAKGRIFAQRAYERMWNFKWTPPGRGLWTMGTRFLYERGGAALNNCGFVSTRNIDSDYAAPFLWAFTMSMLGVGVGFDTRGKGTVTIRAPRIDEAPHTIGDSREGWRQALERLLCACVGQGSLPSEWDYSRIRPRGAALKSFGGRASGPGPLRKMLDSLRGLYDEYTGRRADARLIVDTMNIIGRCVVAGGIRRSAQIALGDPGDAQFLDLKTDEDRVREYRWVSNNSVYAEKGMDYGGIADRTVQNGEPGYLWMDNARAYGRMCDDPNWIDEGAEGSNPCVEQTLWDRELCCLVETFPAHHDSLDDYLETLRVAYLYAKTVTLVPTHDERTNEIMQKNRRIGCSMTGVVQALGRLGAGEFFAWCDKAYRKVQALDEDYSQWLAVSRSIKTTSVKPSGTVSLLSGATPGVHWAYAPFYIRRVRLSADHPMADVCREAGYDVDVDTYADDTVVVSFPVQVNGVRQGRADVSLRDKVELAARMQQHWSDNQVSCTAEFDPDTEKDQIEPILAEYEQRLKAIVFLPAHGHGYEQPPYEEITEGRYREMRSRLKPLLGRIPHEEQLEARFCDGEACEVRAAT